MFSISTGTKGRRGGQGDRHTGRMASIFHEYHASLVKGSLSGGDGKGPLNVVPMERRKAGRQVLFWKINFMANDELNGSRVVVLVDVERRGREGWWMKLKS